MTESMGELFFRYDYAETLIACGFALVLITYAAGEAIYGGVGYFAVAWRSWSLMIAAGIFFVAGLVSLVGAGVISLYAKSG